MAEALFFHCRLAFKILVWRKTNDPMGISDYDPPTA
jgi:hypothetical protein